MSRKALVLIHRGSPTTVRLVQLFREKGLEPVVFSSATADDGAGFHAMCAQLDVEHAIARSVTPTAAEVFQELGGAAETCDLCFAVWEGQRPLMAEINHRLRARDMSPDVIQRAQDKHLVRGVLGKRGLSGITSYRLNDPDLRARLAQRERHIVKPRRGAGSLLARVVSTWEEVESVATSFRQGPRAGDLYEEFYIQNELIAETFFAGREISLEMVRQGGRTLFVCEHEKTSLEFTASTVLERELASPAVGLSEADILAGVGLANRALDVLDLDEGCYHVELRMNDHGAWEIVEVNPRIGGGLIFDSVLQQFGRSMLNDWIDLLTGKALPVSDSSRRRCGTYSQLAYAEPGRIVTRLRKDESFPAPEIFIQAIVPGTAAQGDREDISAITLWLTPLGTHRELVATMMKSSYVTFEYE